MVHQTNSLLNSLACIGGAGQGTNSPTAELGRGSQRGRVSITAPVREPASLDSSKTLEQPAAVLGGLEVDKLEEPGRQPPWRTVARWCVAHLGALEKVIHYYSSHLNITITSALHEAALTLACSWQSSHENS